MGNNKKITFGAVRDIPKNVEETRIIPFVLSTPTRDRHHTVLNQNNWQLDNYRSNAIVGYMHNLYGDLCNAPDPDDVIGMDKNIMVEEINGVKSLVGSPMFEPATINLKSDKVFRKLIFGTLNAASVGFLEVGAGQWGVNEEALGKDNETFYFQGQELLEWSVVNIPSNPQGGKRNMELMRSNTYAAIMYAFRELGKNFRLSQIENLRVRDVLDLLDGKDIEIRETDPDKVRQMLLDEGAKAATNSIIEEQMRKFKK